MANTVAMPAFSVRPKLGAGGRAGMDAVSGKFRAGKRALTGGRRACARVSSGDTTQVVVVLSAFDSELFHTFPANTYALLLSLHHVVRPT